MEVPASLMYDEVEQLYNDEVLNTRRELQESSANLEQLAKYCEQSFLTCQDQQTVFDQSKGYVVHSLVNVSHRLTKLSTSLSQLLNTHNGRLENINHQLHCIQQDFENIESYHSKEKVKSLGVTIAIQRQHKVVQNKSINKDGKKHVRKPIDLSVLDNIGHGVIVPDEPRPVPLHQGQNINNIVGSRDKPTMQRDKSRDNFSRSHHNSLKQNGAGPPRGGDYGTMGGYGNNGYLPQQHPNQIQPQPIAPLHREHPQPLQPHHMQPGQMQPGQMQPGQMQSGQMQPVQMQPGQMQPGQMQPGQMQPGQMQPGQMQPGQMQPGQLQPGQMQPGQMQPGQMQPGQMQPGQLQPGQMQPGQIQPGQMQPGQMQPGQMQPGQMQPGQLQPGQMQPGQLQPGQMQNPIQHPQLQQMQQHSMPNMMPPYNPALETRTLDRNVASLERNFDRALTIDRSIMFDPRTQNMVTDRHPIIGGPGIERISDRSSDRSSDHTSPSVHNQTTFNNWTPQSQEDPRTRGLDRPGYERSFSHGSHGSVPNERSISSDDYATQQYPYNRRDSPQLAGIQHQGYPPQQQYAPQQVAPHMSSQRSITSQNSIASSQGPPLQPPLPFVGQQFHSAKRYGSRGSLDDSSCTSSSPSLQSYKTSNSRNPEYDDGSSQRSTNGPFSDSGLGTWAQSDAPPNISDKISQPMSELDNIDSGTDSGYIPPNYIKKVQSIYRYNKTSDDELTLPVGATVYVLQEHSDGWSEGFYNGQYGYFPANFTTMLVDK